MDNRPWLSNYDSGIPANIHYPEVCVHDLLASAALEIGGHVAIRIGKSSITYRVLNESAGKLAAFLLSQGVRQGEVVGICLSNSLEFVIAFFGILKCGGVVAAMNPAFPMRELQFQVSDTGMQVVITTSKKSSDFDTIAASENQIAHLVLIGENEGSPKPLNIAVSYWDDIIQSGVTAQLPVVHPSQPAVVQFSGGTTGTPKAALGSHRNLVANATQFKHWLVNLEHKEETFLIAIPLYHVYGLVLGLVLGVATGARMIMIEHPGNVDEILAAIKQYPISYFPAVPTIFNRINQHPDVLERRISLATIKACISGSAPLLETVRREFESITGGSLVEGYGLSEAPTATHCNPIFGEKRNGSIGLPLPDVDCRIIDMADGVTELGIGKEGELWIRGPQVMMGYLNNAEENKFTLKEGWLKTGDIARMDEDGYFYLSGRKKELIKVHGMQVWPTEVEEVVNSHPSVIECAAAGIPDKRSGETVKTWVVLHPGRTLTQGELTEFCRDKLAAYKIPQQLEIRDSLPKTGVGKILRRVLLDEEREK